MFGLPSTHSESFSLCVIGVPVFLPQPPINSSNWRFFLLCFAAFEISPLLLLVMKTFPVFSLLTGRNIAIKCHRLYHWDHREPATKPGKDLYLSSYTRHIVKGAPSVQTWGHPLTEQRHAERYFQFKDYSILTL